jgi:hypothetical protein
MTSYQYQWVPLLLDHTGKHMNEKSLRYQIDELGNEGWEMVGATSTYLWFKREVPKHAAPTASRQIQKNVEPRIRLRRVG